MKMKVLTIQVNVTNLTPDEISWLKHSMEVQCEDAGDKKDQEEKGSFDAQILVSKVSKINVEQMEEVNETH